MITPICYEKEKRTASGGPFRRLSLTCRSAQPTYHKPHWVKTTKNGAKPTYKVTAKKSMNGWKYKCLVSNAAGKVYTKTVKLTVK